MSLYISFAIATAVPLLLLYVVWSLDLYGQGAFPTIVLCFGWGLVAFALALGISQVFVYDNLYLITSDTWVRFVAPISEEILKAAILIYLVRRPRFTYFVDGAIYGFAVGMGFAVIENYSYILSFGGDALGVAISRVISTNLIHASASALVGIQLGFSRFARVRGRIIYLLSGLTAAMLLHVGYNNMVTGTLFGMSSVLLYAAGTGLLASVFIGFMIIRGLKEQREWIEEKLGSADRVTGNEARVVHNLDDAYELLEPIRDQFGEDKARAVERFLKLQAQLGIKRKTLDKLQDDRLRKDVEEDMDRIRVEMDEARRDVGTYVMLVVRNIFPEEDGESVWSGLATATESTEKAKAGTGLWDTLGERTGKFEIPVKDEGSEGA